MITIVKDSHVDHGLTQAQLDWCISQFADRTSFFVQTVELPPELGSVKCNLHGPAAGTSPVEPYEVVYAQRGKRNYLSRMCRRPAHDTRKVTVVAGTHGDYPNDGMILFTAYGGPSAPQEHNDPECKDQLKSWEFWKSHALSE